ncbi:TetR/AcrR family transcriptional regulator [Dethiosulfatarculus sandiegensis]|nr:TetR/AcrR family transcriptional regulator [Dethiosulfatarculus sandiegensis]
MCRIIMPKTKTYHHGALRQALISEALNIIGKKGVSAVTMRGLGQALGVSRTAAYRHFDNKHDLLCAVAEDGFNAIADRYGKIVEEAGPDAQTTMAALGRAYVHFAQEFPNMFRLMFSSELAGQARKPSLRAAVHRSNLVLGATVLQCQKQGVIRQGDPQVLANILWAGMHGLARLLVDGQLQTDEQEQGVPIMTTDKAGTLQKKAGLVLDQMVEALLQGLAPKPADSDAT